MWKAFAVIVVLVLVYLFVPRYDLLKQKSMLEREYELVQEGYWSADACHEAGRAYEAGHRCRKTTPWQSIMGNQRNYNKERDVEF